MMFVFGVMIEFITVNYTQRKGKSMNSNCTIRQCSSMISVARGTGGASTTANSESMPSEANSSYTAESSDDEGNSNDRALIAIV